MVYRTFKKKAPKAIRAIRQFATKMMGTTDVRVDSKLNKFIWSKGVRNVPYRVRVRLSRKRNEDEEAKEKVTSLMLSISVVKEPLLMMVLCIALYSCATRRSAHLQRTSNGER